MIVGDGAKLDHLVDIVLDLVLDVVEFLRIYHEKVLHLVQTAQQT